MNSNCPRPLRAIKHIAHALIYVLNSPFSTWYIECMPQSHGHHQTRYNLCHISTPRKSSGRRASVFHIPRGCKCQSQSEHERSLARKSRNQYCRSQNWSRQNLHRNISSQRCLTFSKNFETSKLRAFSSGIKNKRS